MVTGVYYEYFMNVYNHKNTTDDAALEARDLASIILDGSGAGFVVFDFSKAPSEIRKFCTSNEGGEDWLVVTGPIDLDDTADLNVPTWLLRTDSRYRPDLYLFNGVSVFVGSDSDS